MEAEVWTRLLRPWDFPGKSAGGGAIAETKVIQATGGGAYKFKDLIEEKLQLK